MRLLPESGLIAVILVVTAPATSGCGDEESGARSQPTPAEIRRFFGLHAGSCWRYRYQALNATLFAQAQIEGPNTAAVVGEVVYVRTFRRDSGGLADEWYLDTEKDRSIRLFRSVEGPSASERVTHRYGIDAAMPPLFGAFRYGLDREIEFEDAIYATDTTPEVCAPECVSGREEAHTWSVSPDPALVSTPEGEQSALQLEYRIQGDRDETTRYFLVPDLGFARWIDRDGTPYQLCDMRVCDEAGVCRGAESCDALTCSL